MNEHFDLKMSRDIQIKNDFDEQPIKSAGNL